MRFSADRLHAFLAVLAASSFTHAARAMGQSQSSVSQAVAALERELGEQLFVRDGRAVHPTDAARILARRAERALAELEQAEVELASLRDLAAGRLSVGTTDTLALYLLPPIFAEFRRRYPDIDVQLENRPSPVIAERVAEHAVDVGVIMTPLPPLLRLRGKPADEELRIVPLTPVSEVLACPVGHPLAGRRRIALRELSAYPLLLLDHTTGTRAHLERALQRLPAPPRVVMEMSSVEVLKRLVELGFGLSIVPAIATADEVARNALAVVSLQGLGRPRRAAIITSTAGPLSHAARAFIEVARHVGS